MKWLYQRSQGRGEDAQRFQKSINCLEDGDNLRLELAGSAMTITMSTIIPDLVIMMVFSPPDRGRVNSFRELKLGPQRADNLD